MVEHSLTTESDTEQSQTPSVAIDFINWQSTVNRGEFVLPTVCIRNTGTAPISVSTRLNLVEGDLCIWYVGPHGERTQLCGRVQVDSPKRPTELAPDQRLEAGLLLTHSAKGITFETPGQYRLQLEYHPDGDSWLVVSPPLSLQVVPSPDTLQDLAALTLSDEVSRTLSFRGCTTASSQSVVCDQLRTLATTYPDRCEGIISQFILSKQKERFTHDSPALRAAFSARLPPTIARWITALVGPAGAEDELAAAFLTYLDDYADADATTPARQIIRGEPFG